MLVIPGLALENAKENYWDQNHNLRQDNKYVAEIDIDIGRIPMSIRAVKASVLREWRLTRSEAQKRQPPRQTDGHGRGCRTDNSTLWIHAENCFRLGSHRELPSGQQRISGRVLSKNRQDERLIKWIVDDQQSLSVVEDRSFKSVVKSINANYAISTRKTITRQVIITYASHLDVLKSQLGVLDAKVSLTYDVWTSKANLPYASITAHYIDNDWNMRSCMELIMESILNFGLQTKVIGCVSDNEEATVQGIT
ncbi:hypothetical protein V1525DRAFT_422511 [Lipomyces kononenkoae]|uniref:Uncharacterized protein n=1 Tax=Lipomyces kononenkoae TaxID=34357 RepID=A0ACC3SRX7_LIPKO